MRESRMYGSGRGALSNERPYRDRHLLHLLRSPIGTERRRSVQRHVRSCWRKLISPKGADSGFDPEPT